MYFRTVFLWGLLYCCSLSTAFAATEEVYRFERLWPLLYQPWYFADPGDVAIDREGHVYVADGLNFISKFTQSGQLITKWKSAVKDGISVYGSQKIAFDNDGHVYVLSTSFFDLNQNICLVYRNRTISKDANLCIFSTEVAQDSQSCVVIHSVVNPFAEKDNVCIVVNNRHVPENVKSCQPVQQSKRLEYEDSSICQLRHNSNYFIEIFKPNGEPLHTLALPAPNAEDYKGKVVAPAGLAIDSRNHIYISDNNRRMVLEFDSNRQFVNEWSIKEKEFANDDLSAFNQNFGFSKQTFDLAINSKDELYMTDRYGQRIRKYSLDGTLIKSWGRQGKQAGQFDVPESITIDSENNVYVADRFNSRVQKFDEQGTFLQEWKNPKETTGLTAVAFQESNLYKLKEFLDGSLIKQFEFDQSSVKQIVELLKQWQTFLNDPAIAQWLKLDFIAAIPEVQSLNHIATQLNDIDIAQLSSVNVDDVSNLIERAVKQFSSFFGRGEQLFSVDDTLFLPSGVAVTDELYVTSGFPKNSVQKYSLQGSAMAEVVEEWSNTDKQNQYFDRVGAVARDSKGYLYVTDILGHRVLKFDASGRLIKTFGKAGSGYGELLFPIGIAIDSQDNIYVTEGGNLRIQKFSSEGEPLKSWGGLADSFTKLHDKRNTPIDIINFLQNLTSILTSVEAKKLVESLSSGDILGIISNAKNFPVEQLEQTLQETSEVFKLIEAVTRLVNDNSDSGFGGPVAMAIDNHDRIFVLDTVRHRVVQYDTEGQFLSAFGRKGDKEGEFNMPLGIAINNGQVYVADTYNHRIQVFDIQGKFLRKWGTQGKGKGQFDKLYGVAADNNGNVYVADTRNSRVQKFTATGQFVTQWGQLGTDPSQMNQPTWLTVSPDGSKVFVPDAINNRVQIFNLATHDIGKAIIVAGGDKSDNLWSKTQMVANAAYRSLTQQGFTKDTIFYLNDVQLDLDNNGELDDIDAIPTLDKLKFAITDWAKDTENLTLYLTDHGGNATFKLNASDLLPAEKLNQWLNQYQAGKNGNVKIIYDACFSGSFLPQLKALSGQKRLTITSSKSGQVAYFNGDGLLSFSSFFWNHIFNGLDLYEAFTQSSEAVSYLSRQVPDPQETGVEKGQTPLLDANANGIENEDDDFQNAVKKYIGNGTFTSANIPQIISDVQAGIQKESDTSIILTVEVDNNIPVSRVWATVRSPIELDSEKTVTAGNESTTIVELPFFNLEQIDKPHHYQARYNDFRNEGTYVLAVYAKGESGTSIPKTAFVTINNPLKHRAILVGGRFPSPLQNVQSAYASLKTQGYSDDNIRYFNNDSGSNVDAMTSLESVKFAITEWTKEETQDVIIYLEGWGDATDFYLNEREKLAFKDLNAWLNDLQVKGTVTLIYEGPYSGYYVPPVQSAKKWVTITSNGVKKTTCTNPESQEPIFSQAFWKRIGNGTKNVNDAFTNAKNFDVDIILQERGQATLENLPQLHNPVLARETKIGLGIVTAAIEPTAINLSSFGEYTLNGETVVQLRFEKTDATHQFTRFWAVITPPCDTQETAQLVEFQLTAQGHYEATVTGFTSVGTYQATFYYENNRGTRSHHKKFVKIHQNYPAHPLKTSKSVYHPGEQVLIRFPDTPPKNYDHYLAISLPNDAMFFIKGQNDFVPVTLPLSAATQPPLWKPTSDTIIDVAITPEIPRGEYWVYWLQLPAGTPVQLPLPDLQKQNLRWSTFKVE